MSDHPSTNGENGPSDQDAHRAGDTRPGALSKDGRDSRGRFAKGNRGGPGNPQAKKVAALRGALLQAVKPADVKAVIQRMVEQARAGDVPAAKLLLERTLGPPLAIDLLDRIEALEDVLGALNDERGLRDDQS